MRRVVIVIMLAIASLSLLSAGAVAQSAASVSNNQAMLKFPDWIAFSADLKSELEISRVVLEYGSERLTCGRVVAKGFPKFAPSKEVKARWTWEMKQSGSEPPGALVWWRWRVTTADGKEFVTDRNQITWLDDWHPWQSLKAGQLILHWYSGDKAFASTLLGAGDQALNNWRDTAGVKPDTPADIYVYATAQDMRDAVFYEPGWTGGRAYSNYSIVILGIAPSQLEWGKTSVAHELTHVLFDRYTFGCIDDLPLWLTEGLAMYSEGALAENSQRQWNEALSSDRLVSVRALGSNFPEAADEANLSYSESHSLANFLIGEYGQSKIISLLDALRGGKSIDDALRSTYGFDVDGLEDVWRAKIGVQPRRAKALGTPTATPTIVPTYIPVAGLQISTRTATLVPAIATATLAPATPTAVSSPQPSPAPMTPLLVESASRSMTWEPILLGGIVVFSLAVVTFVKLVRRRNG